MRNSILSVLLSSLLCFVIAGCGSSGGGGSSILGGGGDGGTGGAGTLGTLKWSTSINAPTGTGVGPVVTPTFISSPAIAPDGTVYVGATDHFLYALNPDGTVKWKFETGSNLFASPAIGSDGTIYIGSEDRQFYAINPDGTLKWIVPTETNFTSSAAIGADGTIYAAGTDQDKTLFSCTSDSSCASTTAQACSSTRPCPTGQICVPVQTGSLCAIPQDVPCGEGFAPCPTGSACVAGHPAGFTLIAQLGNFFALTDEGTKGAIRWSATLSGVVNSSPAIASDGTIYIGSEGDFVFDRTDVCNLKSAFPPSDANPNPANGANYPVNGHLYALNPNGTLKWDFKTLGHVDSSPAIGTDGTVYVGSQRSLKFYGKDLATLLDENPTTRGFVYAINPNGTRKWVDDLLGDVDSSPAVGSDGTIYVGADNFHVYALNPIDGSIKWVIPTRDKVKSSPALASDGLIYIGSNDKSLYALNPSDGTEKFRFEVGGSVNSGPSIAKDGTIYFSSSDNKLNALFGSKKLAESSWPKFRHDLPNTGRK